METAGAAAFRGGVVFAGTPTKEVVAHEAVHILQLSKGVTGDNAVAEVQAEGAARAIARGTRRVALPYVPTAAVSVDKGGGSGGAAPTALEEVDANALRDAQTRGVPLVAAFDRQPKLDAVINALAIAHLARYILLLSQQLGPVDQRLTQARRRGNLGAPHRQLEVAADQVQAARAPIGSESQTLQTLGNRKRAAGHLDFATWPRPLRSPFAIGLRQRVAGRSVAHLATRGNRLGMSRTRMRFRLDAELAATRRSPTPSDPGRLHSYVRVQHQNTNGQGFDDVIVEFRGDPPKAKIRIVEIKDYPSRYVPLETMSAIRENLSQNMKTLHERFREATTATNNMSRPEEFRALSAREMDALRAALKGNEFQVELHVGPTTVIGPEKRAGSMLAQLRQDLMTSGEFGKPVGQVGKDVLASQPARISQDSLDRTTKSSTDEKLP